MLSSYNLEYGYCELRSPPFYPSLVDYSTALVLIGSIARATTLLKLANTSKNRKTVMLSKGNGFIIILFNCIYRSSCTNAIWLLTYLSDALLLKERHPFMWDGKIAINAANTPKDTLLQSYKECTLYEVILIVTNYFFFKSTKRPLKM